MRGTYAAPARTLFPSVTLSIGIQRESSQQSDMFPPRDIRPRKSWQACSRRVNVNIFEDRHLRSNILFVGWGRLPQVRRPTTVAQPVDGHPTTPRHWWKAFLPSHAPGFDPGKPLPWRLGFTGGAARSFRLRRLCPEGARHISPGEGDASCASVAIALGSVSLRRISPERARQSMHRFVPPFQGLGTICHYSLRAN